MDSNCTGRNENIPTGIKKWLTKTFIIVAIWKLNKPQDKVANKSGTPCLSSTLSHRSFTGLF
ncbi:hypothetical protein OUZ56_015604 [Daphnia magna]|uniref:Uncharacterized protein n=1 Tax=Daphnia magna TaxID=35525 RepID=A0ABR0ANA6_9CRUS|nr:hypothetical protein OUZ56_015604 [Daphnia magna]